MNNQTIVVAERSFHNRCYNLLVLKSEGSEPGTNAIGRLVFEDYEQFSQVPPQPTVALSETQCQQLMDSLWDCGIRPAEGSGSAGSLAATERHLNDMKKIVSKTLKVEL